MVVLLHKVLILDQGSPVQAQQVALILVLHNQPHLALLTLDQLHLRVQQVKLIHKALMVRQHRAHMVLLHLPNLLTLVQTTTGNQHPALQVAPTLAHHKPVAHILVHPPNLIL
jgi:hypothetical protein